MKNKKGLSVKDRIVEEIDLARRMGNSYDRILLATKALGAADLALEFGLITYREWDNYVSEIFDITG